MSNIFSKNKSKTAKGCAEIIIALSLGCQTTALAQGTPAPVNDSNSNVYMTMYPVQSGANGQEFFTNNSKQSEYLPGAGVEGPAVCIYTAPNGSQWYIDRTGTQQSLPPLQGSAMVNEYQSSGSSPGYAYGNPNYNNGTDYYQRPAVTNNYYNSTAGGGGLLGAVAGTALGAVAGTALGMGLASIPYGTPVYWGGGHPWYLSRATINGKSFSTLAS